MQAVKGNFLWYFRDSKVIIISQDIVWCF